jgi:hypothetical protein
MREAEIKIGPYQFLDLQTLEIHKKVNEHVTVKIVGRIAETLEDQYVDITSNNQELTIKAVGEDGQEALLFNGVVKSVAIKSNNNVRTLRFRFVFAGSLSSKPHFPKCATNLSKCH